MTQIQIDSSFTDWLFAEAEKGAAPGSEVATSIPTAPTAPAGESKSHRDSPIVPAPGDLSRRPPNAPRAGAQLYQQAISSTLSGASPTSQKRTASARSPSPTGHGPSKARRTDLPTGPRAMQNNTPSRSLLDRVGGRNGNPSFSRNDEIQARIDAVTSGSTQPDPNMMMQFQNGSMNGMEMAMAPNPLMLQEMMMNQMALMAQMATSMGMLNPSTGQMVPTGQMVGGFPMQQSDMAMYPGGVNGHAFTQNSANGRGRGGATRGGRGRGGSRGGHVGSSPAPPTITEVQAEISTPAAEPPQPVHIVAPVPTPAQPTGPITPETPQPKRIPYALPERPQSPTLCKFGTKCTNSQCRFSHPSPVATAESGVVLSTDACEKGKDCQDKDCIKSHVSPAVNNPGMFISIYGLRHLTHIITATEAQKPPVTHSVHAPPTPSHPSTPCRFGPACTRPSCSFSHPWNQPCRFGAGCTRATCPYQHPEGRVLPTTFHRGLSTHAPTVNVSAPGAPSPHRSVTFNKGTDNVKEKLEKQIKELEAQKKAVAEAEAAATGKGESSKSAPIAV